MPHTAAHLPYQFCTLSTGNKVAYIDKGSGEHTLVFLHGLANYSGTWIHNIEVLQNYFRCVALDFPGNGYSEKGDYPFSMAYYATSVLDLLQQLGLKKVVLCGHSMGGQVAMTIALLAPDLVDRLVLCAPAGLEQFNVYEKAIYRSALGFTDFIGTHEQYLRDLIYGSFAQNPFQADPMIHELLVLMKQYPPNLYKKMVDASIHAMLNESVYNKLGRIQMPVLIVFGEMDALIPNRIFHFYSTAQLAKEAVSKLPKAELLLFPNAGHFVQWECADQINQKIIKLLS